MNSPNSADPSSPPWRIAGYLFLVGAAFWYGAHNFAAIQSNLGLPSDFTHYYEAGQSILHGRTPYTDPEFNYPPVLAFAIAPLALTSYQTARWIWFLASHIMLLGAAVLVWRFLGRGLGAACCVALVWAGGGAAGESLALGQVGPLLVLLLAITFTTCGTSRGIATGVGAAVKILPGVLALPLALAREWRALIAGITAAALLILLPMLALQGFDGPKSPAYAAFLLGSPTITNWSVPATVLRVLDPPASHGALPANWEFGNQGTALRLPESQRIASAAASLFVFIVGAMLLVWRTRCLQAGPLREEHLPAAMAGWLSLALAAAPVCWSHYQILQYPGVALLLGLAVAHRRWKLAVATVVCAALLYPVPVAILAAYYHHYGWTAASPWQLYVWTSATPAACLGIFGLSLKLAGLGKKVPCAIGQGPAS